MLEKIKANKKTIIIVLIVAGALLTWWQSRDTKEAPVEPVVQEEIVNE